MVWFESSAHRYEGGNLESNSDAASKLAHQQRPGAHASERPSARPSARADPPMHLRSYWSPGNAQTKAAAFAGRARNLQRHSGLTLRQTAASPHAIRDSTKRHSIESTARAVQPIAPCDLPTARLNRDRANAIHATRRSLDPARLPRQKRSPIAIERRAPASLHLDKLYGRQHGAAWQANRRFPFRNSPNRNPSIHKRAASPSRNVLARLDRWA